MKDLLKMFIGKNLLANESEELQLKKFDSTTLELFQNIIKNKGRKPTEYRLQIQQRDERICFDSSLLFTQSL